MFGRHLFLWYHKNYAKFWRLLNFTNQVARTKTNNGGVMNIIWLKYATVACKRTFSDGLALWIFVGRNICINSNKPVKHQLTGEATYLGIAMKGHTKHSISQWLISCRQNYLLHELIFHSNKDFNWQWCMAHWKAIFWLIQPLNTRYLLNLARLTTVIRVFSGFSICLPWSWFWRLVMLIKRVYLPIVCSFIYTTTAF